MDGRELRQARETLGKTQLAFGELLGLKKNGNAGRQVRRWELGEVPVPEYIDKLVEYILRDI